MIEFMRVQRFKTLMDASFPLAGLNIFSGLNGMGKSSLLQVLLLLRQSNVRGLLFTKGLLLNGDYVSLGTGSDVLAEHADEESIEFLIKFENSEAVVFNFKYLPDNEVQPYSKEKFQPTLEGIVDYSQKVIINGSSLFSTNFQYLAADRIRPQTTYPISDYNINELNSLGNNGLYTAHYIAVNSSKNITLHELKHQNANSVSLIENLNCWMSDISPGTRIIAKLERELNSVSLCYAFEQDKNLTANYKPQNVGFGLTYVLPVITAILRANKGDLLIIENPESHLHPAGQSIIGKLCALAANAGVQLFIESHSDHFLNGVRVAVKEGIVKHDNVRLFYFEREGSESFSTTIITPEIDDNGRINTWPKGFFDESDRQLEKLL